jgi:C-methyltransferase C-terminal domain/Putative zinc binding domain
VSTDPACLSCGAPLRHTLIDLGEQPLANAYLVREQLEAGDEPRYPLHARICTDCLLVQVEKVVSPAEIFSDYAYFSSYSPSWLAHCSEYARTVTDRLGLGPDSMVIEVASNDGHLLANFVAAGMPVLGVEPAANVAKVAVEAGVPTQVAFFGRACAAEITGRGGSADLVAAILKPSGVLTVEVPHLLRMIEGTEFDTIYHEHLSYFSLLATRDVLMRRGLRVFDVDELTTHGGSLRIWASRADASKAWPETAAVERVLETERAAGLHSLEGYREFASRVESLLADLRRFLGDAKAAGERVAAYGAAAKGNTLLNTAEVTTEEIGYVVDRSPHKQGRFLPGSHLPILEPDHVRNDRPDYLLVLPWNLRDEITAQMADVQEWGCRFVVPVPRLELVP